MDPGQDRHRLWPVPGTHERVYKLHEAMMTTFWPPSKLDFEEDVEQWHGGEVPEGMARLVRGFLAFVARVDALVEEQIMDLSAHVADPFLSQAYLMQAAQESMHSTAYQRCLMAYVQDRAEREALMAVSPADYPSIGRKREWYLRHMDCGAQGVAHVLVAAMAMEGVCFSTLWAVVHEISRLRGRDGSPLLPGFVAMNQYVRRDESTHGLLHCAAATLLERPTPGAEAEAMVRELVDIEVQFYEEIYGAPEGAYGTLSPAVMRGHVQYTANFWMQQMGYALPYAGVTRSPLEGWDDFGLPGIEQFFETEVTQYNTAGSLGQAGQEEFADDY